MAVPVFVISVSNVRFESNFGATIMKSVTTVENKRDMKAQFSDGTLRVLNSNFKEVAKVKFLDLFPVSLSSLDFDASSSDVQYFTAEASFKYTVYQLTSSI